VNSSQTVTPSQPQLNAVSTPAYLSANAQPFAPMQQVSLLTRMPRRALIPTAVVLIKDACGVFQSIRALLDSCSEINLITEEKAKILRLRQIRSPQVVNGISDATTQIKFVIRATIRSRISEFEWTSHFAAVKAISNTQPGEYIDVTQWNIPNNIEFADPLFFTPHKVDVLISSEIFFDLLLNEKISLGANKPSLINTTLVWIVGGSYSTPADAHANRSACHFASYASSTEDTLKKFWEIEDYQQTQPLLSAEEQACEDHCLQNTSFAADGRVQVRIPFKNTNMLLGQLFQIAQKRFYSLERRMERDVILRQHYVDFMNEYVGCYIYFWPNNENANIYHQKLFYCFSKYSPA